MQLESEAIRGVLEPDESLLWSGRPEPFRPTDALLVAGFVLVWGYTGRSTVQGSLNLMSVLFFAAALWAFGLALYAFIARLHTCYGVTSKRIVIVQTLRTRSVTSLDLLTLGAVVLKPDGRGRGTVVLEPARFGLVEGASLPASDEDHPAPRLHRIEGAEAVRDIIEAARRKVEAMHRRG